MKTIVDHLLAKASAAESTPEDYIDPADGLRHCGRCRAPKEAWFSAEMQREGYKTHPAECLCVRARREAEAAAAAEEKARAEARRRAAYVRHLKAESGIPVPDWRFDREDLVWNDGLQKPGATRSGGRRCAGSTLGCCFSATWAPANPWRRGAWPTW